MKMGETLNSFDNYNYGYIKLNVHRLPTVRILNKLTVYFTKYVATSFEGLFTKYTCSSTFNAFEPWSFSEIFSPNNLFFQARLGVNHLSFAVEPTQPLCMYFVDIIDKLFPSLAI